MGFDQVILYEITIGLSYSGSTGAWGASSLGSIPSSPTIIDFRFFEARRMARSAPLARQGWEAAHPCVSKEAKPAKIVSLIEKEFCARPLKDLSIFTGFAGRRQAASRWAGSAPVRAQIVAQKRFERRSAIATRLVF